MNPTAEGTPFPTDNDFFKVLFDSLPMPVLLLDQDGTIHAVNSTTRHLFSLDSEGPYSDLSKVFHCIGNSKICGSQPACRNCELLNAVRSASNGQGVVRRRARLNRRGLDLLVSASPLTYRGASYVLFMLEDISELVELRRRVRDQDNMPEIIGRDEQIVSLREQIQFVAPVNAPVLIEGESGVGKELVASSLHRSGPRSSKPFVVVNCAALNDNLLESELFGHERGAFTGAVKRRKGMFEMAHGGTVFLDEIGDVSPAMQVKLLRVLQEGTFMRVGGEQTISVDVRVISATNKHLQDEVAAGNFREDLYYRLCVIPIYIPPLRERRNDIPQFVERFLDQLCEQDGRERVTLSPEALAALQQHHWPGNVRQLHNILHHALVQCRGRVIQSEHLNFSQSPAESRVSRRKRKKKLDRAAVDRALRQCEGNKRKAAQHLGVARATLYRFLSEGQ